MSIKMKPIILVHGGAAIIAKERIPGKILGVKTAAKKAYEILKNRGKAVDAVEIAIKTMEDNPYFNAGYGSVLNLKGEVEMDASIMDGSNLNAGAVALVRNISNPISLARLVMEKTPHVLLAARGTTDFAKTQNVPIVEPHTLISEYSREVLEAFIKSGCRTEDREIGGTVGAVALDEHGNIAAGTSTGGTNGKMKGRIGDTPQIGSGTYADNNIGAISSTGNGEVIIRHCLAHAVIKEMESGRTAAEACKNNITSIKIRLQGSAGVICISRKGDVGISFSTKMMPWAYKINSEIHFGVLQDEHKVEHI